MINNQNTFDHNYVSYISVLGASFFAITLSPFLVQSIPTSVYAFLAFFLFLILSFNKKTEGKSILYLLALLPFVILNSIGYLLESQYNGWARYVYGQLLTVIPLLLIYYFFISNKRKETLLIVIVVFLLYIATSVTTIIGLVEDPLASRFLATADALSEAVRVYLNLKNIGGFGFVYSLVFLMPMTIGCYKEKKLPLIVFLAIFLLTWVCVVFSQYGEAFMMMTVITVMLLLPNGLVKSMGKRFILSIIVLVIITVIIAPTIANVLRYVTSLLGGERYVLTSRIESVADLLVDADLSGGAAGNRIDRYLASWRLFVQNPLMGTFLTGGAMGGHSHILDNAAKYGIWGILILFLYYFVLYKTLYFPFGETQSYVYMKISFFLFVVHMFLNTVSGPLFNISLFFMVPALGYMLQKRSYRITETGIDLTE